MAEALRDEAVPARGQEQAVLVEQPPVHRVAGEDVLRDQELHEAVGRDDLHPARVEILLRDEAAHAAPVVGMGVRIDDRRDRQPLAHMLLQQLPGRPRRLDRGAHVEGDPAGGAAHEGDVGQVEATHLIDAGNDLVEAEIVVEPPDAGHRGVDRVELARRVEEVVVGPVEGDVAGVGHDLALRALGDQPARLFLEVAGVVEGQRGFRRLDRAYGVLGRRLALGVKVALERLPQLLLLRVRRALVEQRAAQREGRARGGNGTQNLASGGHRLPPNDGHMWIISFSGQACLKLDQTDRCAVQPVGNVGFSAVLFSGSRVRLLRAVVSTETSMRLTQMSAVSGEVAVRTSRIECFLFAVSTSSCTLIHWPVWALSRHPSLLVR